MRKSGQILAGIFISLGIFSQDLNNIDLSKLNPEQIELYKKYINSKSGDNISGSNIISTEKRGLSTDSLKSENNRLYNSEIFGSYLFNTQNLTFEPKLNIPTPTKYILGAYDEVLIDISGLYETNFKLKVNTEGSIRIPNVGPVKVSGLTIEDASKKIRNEVSKFFQGISSGETRVNISLGNIRSISVIVVGNAVRPGTYTLPSLATAFNALYACGGPNETGSMRDIKVIRKGKTVASLDVYGILADGIPTNDIALQDGDVIRIEPYKTRVYIEGAVKQSGIFEGLPHENLQQYLNFTGGFSEKADKNKIGVFRYTEAGRTVSYVPYSLFKSFIPESGDSVFVNSMFQDKDEYTVTITGAVRNPGTFKLTENISLKDLLARANGFTEMALTDSVEIVRAIKNSESLQKNENKSVVFKIKANRNISEISTSDNFLLENGDQVIIRNTPGFENIRMIRVEGEVNLPGTYNIKNKSERVSDVIERSGGFTQYAFPANAYLIRIDKLNDVEQKLNKIVRGNTINQLKKNQNKSLDLNTLKSLGSNSALVDSMQKNISGNDVAEKLFSNENVVGLNLDFIMKNKGSRYDLKLEEGDIIYIPREQQTVKISGQVLFPTIVCYDENFKLEDYVLNSGGFTSNASKKSIFVLYSNGNVKGTKSFLFLKKYPDIEPGAQIIIPEKPLELKSKLTIGETVGLLTSTTSMMVLIYTLIANKP